MRRLLALLLFSAVSFSQTATKPAAKPAAPAAKTPAAQSSRPAAPAERSVGEAKGEVPPTAAVITINGLCEGKIPATPTPDCKTVVTRAAFEKLTDALDPRMPAASRQRLATLYAQMLVMSDAAEQRGLSKSADAEELLHFSRMQALTQMLIRALQKEAANVPAAEAEAYYKAHPQQFEQATLLRIFLPRMPPGGEKPTDEKILLAEAGKIRAAAAAGGDFEKLQKQAYDDLGIKTPPPPTAAGTQRRENLSPSQAKVFDLQAGQVSDPIDDAGGIYIFKVESKKTLTLAEVTPEINRTLEQDRMKAEVEKLTSSVKPVFNEEYFGPTPGFGTPAPHGMPSGQPARPGGPPPGAPSAPPPKK
jgi:hypothetical protein